MIDVKVEFVISRKNTLVDFHRLRFNTEVIYTNRVFGGVNCNVSGKEFFLFFPKAL